MLVQRQLADVGIDMKLEPVTLRQLALRARTGDFDAFLFEMGGGALNWVYDFWHSGNGLLATGYTSIDGSTSTTFGRRTPTPKSKPT